MCARTVREVGQVGIEPTSLAFQASAKTTSATNPSHWLIGMVFLLPSLPLNLLSDAVQEYWNDGTMRSSRTGRDRPCPSFQSSTLPLFHSPYSHRQSTKKGPTSLVTSGLLARNRNRLSVTSARGGTGHYRRRAHNAFPRLVLVSDLAVKSSSDSTPSYRFLQIK